jgi:hypothetical protein
MDAHQRAALKESHARLVLKRNDIVEGLRSRTESWSALHEVCREIANLDQALRSAPGRGAARRSPEKS